jgi:hypothetical protein
MKPEPKPLQIVCSCCGLDWEKHGAKPTLAKCVELLKAELAKRSRPQTYFYASAGPHVSLNG